MCNKCSNLHQELFDNHQINSIEHNSNEIFTNICKVNNHSIKLQYYCKNHNTLCRAACVTKIEGEGNGQHKDCSICFIEQIKDEKIKNLNKNIKYLEDLSQKLEELIKDLKKMLEEVNQNKEELKIHLKKKLQI